MAKGKAKAVKKESPVEGGSDTETIFKATLTIAQVLKSAVVLNVVPAVSGPPVMHEARLTVDRKLLPADYDMGERREYSLVIKRVK